MRVCIANFKSVRTFRNAGQDKKKEKFSNILFCGGGSFEFVTLKHYGLFLEIIQVCIPNFESVRRLAWQIEFYQVGSLN